MDKGVTILICSYNGATRLPATIAHVAAQQIPGNLLEVIFVDNASTDNSSAVAAAEWEKHAVKNVPFRIIHEPTPGKIHALHNGVSNARFTYMIICDDDNWLDPHYAATVMEILDNNPRIGAVGGQSAAATNRLPLPPWFEDAAMHYAVGKQAEQTGDVTARGFLWGAGLGTRTDLYLRMYQHFPSFLIGRKEDKLTAGEDGEYCQRLLLKGYRLYYDDRLTFQHFMPENRLSLPYWNALIEGLEASNTTLDKYFMATRLQAKCAGRPFTRYRLLIKAAFKYLFTGSKENKDTLALLLPFDLKHDPVIQAIKHFR